MDDSTTGSDQSADSDTTDHSWDDGGDSQTPDSTVEGLHGKFVWDYHFTSEHLESFALSPNGEAVVVSSMEKDFDGPNGVLKSRGGSDLLLQVFSAGGELNWAARAGGPGDEYSHGVTIGDDGQIVALFEYEGQQPPIFAGKHLPPKIDESSGLHAAALVFDDHGVEQGAVSFAFPEGMINAGFRSQSVGARGVHTLALVHEHDLSTSNFGDFPAWGQVHAVLPGLVRMSILQLDPNSAELLDAHGVGATPISNWSQTLTAALTDANGGIYLLGHFRTSDREPEFQLGSEFLTSTEQSQDVFVAKLNSKGDLRWVRSLGGGSNTEATGATFDLNGRLVVCGNFTSSDGNPFVVDDEIEWWSEDADSFVLALNGEGRVESSLHIGGPRSQLLRIGRGGDGQLTVFGTGGTGVRFGPMRFEHEGNLQGSVFMGVIDTNLRPAWGVYLPSNLNADLEFAQTDKQGELSFLGWYIGEMDFGGGEREPSDNIDFVFGRYAKPE